MISTYAVIQDSMRHSVNPRVVTMMVVSTFESKSHLQGIKYRGHQAESISTLNHIQAESVVKQPLAYVEVSHHIDRQLIAGSRLQGHIALLRVGLQLTSQLQ